MSNQWRHNANGLEGEKQREAQCRVDTTLVDRETDREFG
jgi:hypothetical protein